MKFDRFMDSMSGFTQFTIEETTISSKLCFVDDAPRIGRKWICPNAHQLCYTQEQELLLRTFCNRVLQMIKDEGAFSTMHSLLVYLQMAPMEKQPAIASRLLQLDLLVCLHNGEVLSLVHSKGRLFSSHSDGTIKVWDAGRRGLRSVQEIREHSKAVTCLYVPSSGNKLYSSSLDKTIRVWEITPEEILIVQIHDMKETVHCLTATADLVCYASQGTGVKVYNGSGNPKHVNLGKNVKCLAVEEGNLYCGCTSYSIQEVDLSKCTSTMLYSGTRKLLGKQTILALQIQDDVLYAGGSSVDGTAGKAFSLSTKTAIGSFTTGIDIHCMTVSSDFVFTGTKCGIIEVWLRERLTRVGSIKVGNGSNTKVTTLASDSDGEMLFSGSADGKIQVWALD